MFQTGVVCAKILTAIKSRVNVFQISITENYVLKYHMNKRAICGRWDSIKAKRNLFNLSSFGQP